MLNMILKKALIFSLLIYCINAKSGQGKEFLANQCRELSRVVNFLAEHQDTNECADKLTIASFKVKEAASFIMEELNNAAKQELQHSIAVLQYAELLSCKRYIQIAHSKFEAQKIKILI